MKKSFYVEKSYNNIMKTKALLIGFLLLTCLVLPNALAWYYWNPAPACQSVQQDLTKTAATPYVVEFSSRNSYTSANRPYLLVNGISVPMIADAEVKSVTPCKNYGYDSAMRVSSYNENAAFPREGSRVYVKARLPISVTSITSCQIVMYDQWDTNLGTWSKVSVSKINPTSTNSWSETGITWNNQPCGSAQKTFNSKCDTIPLDEKVVNSRYVRYGFDVTTACKDALANNPSRNVGLVFYAW